MVEYNKQDIPFRSDDRRAEYIGAKVTAGRSIIYPAVGRQAV